MEGHSAHSTAPLRSRSSQTHTPSPSHSASASVGSSVHKRKLASEEHPATFPFYANDDVESISARGAETETEDESEEVVDEEEDNDSMRTFTTARLENNNVSGRSTKLKTESSTVKVDSSSVLEVGKEERGPTAAVQAAAGAGGGSVAGIVVKEDMKSIFTENLQTSGAYSAREESLKREEEAGRLKFVCFANDGIDEHMIWLIGLKNIFARQLPNMPKEYIVRLVMDRSHKSVMVIRHNVVVGGITYRPYVSQKFGEIAFCAITADEQVKGYGTRLMNHLKQHARDVDGLTHFLTYADNNAVGYFNKQGFTKEIHLDKEIWQGYIKDYDGGILMECKIDPKLPYTDLSTMIRRQRQAIDEKIRELSNCHIVYPGIDFQKKEAGISKKIIKVEEIPGLREAGFTADQWGHSRFKTVNASSDSVTYRQSLTTFMRTLLKMMYDHPDAWPFKEPVDGRDVPDYYDIIKDPMEVELLSRVQHRNLISLVGYCEQFGGQGTEGIRILVYEYASNGSLLEYIIGRNGKSLAWRQRVNIAIGAAKDLKTMSKRLESEQYYVTFEMFVADVKRMFANARTYNSPDTIYYKCATRLENFFSMKVQFGLQAVSKVQ